MKRFLLLLSVVLIVFVAVYRQRLFLRNPLAKVYRNGVRQQDVRVYINYSTDILVEGSPGIRFYIVQNWNRLPGVPQALTCLHAMVCWSDHDEATLLPLAGSKGPATMSNREITFRQSDGGTVRVTLR